MNNQYKYFLAVAKYENLHRAAESLFMTQPALSASINRLEKELDVQLLQRDGRRIKLTPIAQQLVPYFNDICNNLTKIYDTVDSYKKSLSSTISIGTTIRHTVLAVDEFLLTYPKQSLALHQYFKYEDIKEALFTQNLHFCITSPIVDDPAISNEVLIHETLCVLMHSDNPLSELPFVNLKDLNDLPTFRHPDGFPFNMTLDRIIAATDYLPKQITAIADNASLLLMLLSDRCHNHYLINPVSRCREIVELHPDLIYRPIYEADAYREIGISWLAKYPLSKEAKAFVDFLRLFYSRDKYHL